jgi:hypothetical protein
MAQTHVNGLVVYVGPAQTTVCYLDKNLIRSDVLVGSGFDDVAIFATFEDREINHPEWRAVTSDSF